MKVIIYNMRGNKRNQAVTVALQAGIARAQTDDHVTILDEATYTHPLNVDVVCFYGLSGNLMRIFQDYRAKGIQTVFFDLGIWGRKGEPQSDFHRVAINDYMPTKYFQVNATPERFLQFGRVIKPWRKSGSAVLVVGMSDRAAKVWGFGSDAQHAAEIIATVRKHTDRPILYTAKKIHENPMEMSNVRYVSGLMKDILQESIWCTVTYQSHVAVDGLIEGIPTFVLGDHPAKLLSHNDLTKIEEPLYLSDPARLNFCSQLAWHQYSLREMRSGMLWKNLFKHGWLTR